MELVRNGGFEAEKPGTPWVQVVSRGRGHLIVGKAQTVRPVAGERMARLGGSNHEEDRLEQTILVPNGLASLELDFRFLVRASGDGATATDRLDVRLLDPDDRSVLAEIATLTNGDESGEWRSSATASLLPWQGRLVTLSFAATTDKNKPTAFFLDEVSLRYTAQDSSGSVNVVILNPRTGCLGGGGGGGPIVVSGVLPLEARAAYSGGIQKTLLEIDGEVVDLSWGPGVFHLLDTAILSPGEHTVDVTTTTDDGQVRRCSIRIRPTPVLVNGDFEGDLTPEWAATSNSPGRLFQGAGPNPTPVFGQALLRMGEVGNVSETVAQTFRVPLDATSAALTYYYLVRTDRSGAQAVDRVDMKLQRLAGGIGPGGGAAAEWIVDSLTNLSAVPVSGDPQVGWTLANVSIPGPVLAELVGSDVRLVLAGKNGGGQGASTFHFDAASLVVQSAALTAIPPPAAWLTVGGNGELLCGTVELSATSDRDVDQLAIVMDSDLLPPLATCFGCRSVGLNWDTSAFSGCHRLWAVARSSESVTRSDARFVAIDNIAPTCEPAAPPSAGEFTGRSDVRPASSGGTETPLFSDRFFVEATVSSQACLVATAVVTDDGDVLLAWPGREVAGWIERGRLPTGAHRLAVRTTSIGGQSTLSAFVEIDVLLEECRVSTRCENRDALINAPVGDHNDGCVSGNWDDEQRAAANCYRLIACEVVDAYRAVSGLGVGQPELEAAGVHLRNALQWAQSQRNWGLISEFDGYSAYFLSILGWELSSRWAQMGFPSSNGFDSFDSSCSHPTTGLPGCRSWLYQNVRGLIEGGISGGDYLERERRCGAAGNTCAEERVGYALGLAAFGAIMSPDAQAVIDRPCLYSWSDFAMEALSGDGIATDADCGPLEFRLTIKDDLDVVECSVGSTPFVRLWNHREENAAYGAATLSGFAALDRIATVGSRWPSIFQNSGLVGQLAAVGNWVVSKAAGAFAYRADCLRLRGVGAFATAPCCRQLPLSPWNCDAASSAWPIRARDAGCDGVRAFNDPSPESCPQVWRQACAVGCGDFCQTSSEERQPCWTNLTAFLSLTRGDDLRNRHFSGRGAVDDDTTLLYEYGATGFPRFSVDYSRQNWRFCVPPVVVVQPPEPVSGGVRLQWQLPWYERSSGYRVFRRPDDGRTCDPRVSSECGWVGVSGVVTEREFVDRPPTAGVWRYFVEGVVVEGCSGYRGPESEFLFEVR